MQKPWLTLATLILMLPGCVGSPAADEPADDSAADTFTLANTQASTINFNANTLVLDCRDVISARWSVITAAAHLETDVAVMAELEAALAEVSIEIAASEAAAAASEAARAGRLRLLGRILLRGAVLIEILSMDGTGGRVEPCVPMLAQGLFRSPSVSAQDANSLVNALQQNHGNPGCTPSQTRFVTHLRTDRNHSHIPCSGMHSHFSATVKILNADCRQQRIYEPEAATECVTDQCALSGQMWSFASWNVSGPPASSDNFSAILQPSGAHGYVVWRNASNNLARFNWTPEEILSEAMQKHSTCR